MVCRRKKNVYFIVLLMFLILSCEACSSYHEKYEPEKLKQIVSECYKSESCFLLIDGDSTQVIVNPEEYFPPIKQACLSEGITIEIASQFKSSNMGMVFARCVDGDEARANITLWYFPNGYYNTTVVLCRDRDCETFYSPI